MAGSPLELGFSAPSSASTGDALNDLPFAVTFGDAVAGEGANGGGGSSATSPLNGWVNDAIKGVVVALVAKFLWGQLK